MSYLVLQTFKVRTKVSKLLSTQYPPEQQNEPNQPEVARAVRHQDFDTRISSIADELGITPPYRTSSIVAEELHPLVRNIPHNSISVRPGEAPNDLEVAE